MSKLLKLAKKVLYGSYVPGVDDKSLLDEVEDQQEIMSMMRGKLDEVSSLIDGDMGDAIDWIVNNEDSIKYLLKLTKEA